MNDSIHSTGNVIDIERYGYEDAARWDDFVAHSRNGTLFHTRRFLTYHPEDRFIDHSLLCTKEDRIIAVLTAVEVQDANKRLLVSHPGASYGGLVLSAACGMADTGAILAVLEDYARGQGFDGISFLRLTPPSIRAHASDDQEYWLYWRKWMIGRFELATSASIDGKDDPLEIFTARARRCVRQAGRAGVVVRMTDDFAAFWPLLISTLSSRHQAKPTHSVQEIQKLAALFPDAFHMFGAYYQDTLIAGVVTVDVSPTSLYTFYFGQNYDYQHLRPIHSIVHDIMIFARGSGKKIVDFGISTEAGGEVANSGLFVLKESFGGFSVRRESWQIIF